MKKAVIIILVFMVCMSSAFSLGFSDTYRTEETDDNDPNSYAYIGTVAIAAPLNYFLIVKKSNDICAIRFTGYRRGDDEKKPSLFSGGEESLYAEYDWYYLGTNKKFVGKTGHVKLSRTSTVQILGFHAFMPGVSDIKCGELRLAWSYPIAVTYLGGGGVYLLDAGIALTSWTDIAQVDLANPNLRWYFYDSGRAKKYIHVKELVP